jgi:hypothetical protein
MQERRLPSLSYLASRIEHGKNGTWEGGSMTWDSEIVDGLSISTPKSEAVCRS